MGQIYLKYIPLAYYVIYYVRDFLIVSTQFGQLGQVMHQEPS